MNQDLAGVRVLVVDDSEGDREFVQYILNDHGAETELSSSVADGLASFARKAPDVVVCDYLFRAGDPTANTFINELQRGLGDPGPRVPVVLLSDHGRSVPPYLLLKAGFDEVCVKPIPPEHLISILTRLTKRARVAAES